MTSLASVGDRVARGAYAVAARFRRSAHFRGPGGLVCLVDASLGAGPLNVAVSGADFRSVGALAVAGDAVTLDGESFPFDASRVYRSAIVVPAGAGSRFAEGRAVLEAQLLTRAPPLSLAFLLDARRENAFRGGFASAFVRRMRAGADLLRRGDPAAGAATLRGCGYGSTPSGDDFLAGVLIAWHVLQLRDGRSRADRIDAVGRAAAGIDGIAGAFLAVAREGRVDAGMKALIAALAAGGESGIRRAVATVLAHGATSGADLATGFAAALRWEDGEAGEAHGS